MERYYPKKTTKISPALKRILTGFGIVVVVSTAVFSGSIGFSVLILILHVLAIQEYQKLTNLSGFTIQNISMQLTGFLMILFSLLIAKNIYSTSILLLFIPLVPVLFIIELFRNSETAFENTGLTLLGTIWISLSFSLFLYISFLGFPSGQYNPHLIIGYFIILWCGDSGAYFVGTLMGKRKLFYRISPGKTWEGSIGGFAFAWLAGYINSVFIGQLLLDQWLLLALLINISGTFGDLTKSMLKRSVGVKDSGTILPGHGGVLDRFDSLIGSAPFAFIYLFLYV